MGDGPERLAKLQQMVKIMVAYMPYKFTSHRILTDLTQSWMDGYIRHPISNSSFWRYVDIDSEMQMAAIR
jgi:ABC-type transport system substrate-binding protein